MPATSTVHAAPAPDPAPAVAGGWYGWQILATDASALALGLAIGAASADHGNRRFGNTLASAWGLGMLGSLSVHAPAMARCMAYSQVRSSPRPSTSD